MVPAAPPPPAHASHLLVRGRGSRLAAILVFALVGGPAVAQSDCAVLSEAIAGLERAPAVSNALAAIEQSQSARTRVADAEAQFARAGCEAQLRTGGLDGTCTAFSNAVVTARADLAALERAISEAGDATRRHDALLDAYRHGGCDGGSGVTFSSTDGSSPGLRSLLDPTATPPRSSPGFITEPAFDLRGTRRTLCVRTCDGAYWPVSYATTQSYFARDAQACRAQCPGAETALYSHATQGEDVSDMVSFGGLRYARQPFAFAFREEDAPHCSCGLGEAGFADVGMSGRFALPSAPTMPHVRLPLPRPVFPGEEMVADAPTEAVGEPEDLRLYQSGDRLIRIVGPVTAYTPEAQEGP